MDSSLLKSLRAYFSKQPIEKAWLFGSMSRGDESPDSDVDILVRFDAENQIGLFRHASMISDLEHLLKRSVDLVSESALFPWVKESVDHDKILIYEREAKR